MNFDPTNYRVIVAGDVSERDGIGVEIYRGETLLVEIFRDDTRKTRNITIFAESVALEEMEGFIRVFKEKIPWDFME